MGISILNWGQCTGKYTMFELRVSIRFLRETSCEFQKNMAKLDRSSERFGIKKCLQILLRDKEIDLCLWSLNRNLVLRLCFFTTQLYFLLSSFFNIGWYRYMSTINMLVLTIFTLVKIVRKIRRLSHSSCTVSFVDPQGILEIYYSLYLLDLNQHPRRPQLSNELYF